MWYKISLFLFGLLLVSAGKRFLIMHWPHGKLIFVSGLVLSAWMVIWLLYGMVSRKRNN